MRVACVCADPGVPTMGRKGCSIHVRAIAGTLTAQGHEVTLICSRLGGSPPDALASVRAIEARAPGDANTLSQLDAGLARDRVITQALAHEHTARGPFDLVYARHALWSCEPLVWAQRAGIPSVLEVNAPIVDEQARYRTLTHRQDAQRIERAAVNLADVVVAVSSGVARAIAPMIDHPQHVRVVHNGVDTATISPNTQPAMPAPGRVTVGFVGTLKPWHGLDLLIDAMVLLRERWDQLRLLVVGDGPERARLDQRVTALGMADLAHFTGPVDSSQIPGLLTSMDIAVAPYPHIDGFYFSPLKLFEYMAAGRACVTTRVGDLPDLIDDGQTGLLAPPDDPQALARAIGQLIDAPSLRAQLGAQARQRAVDQHDWHAVVDQILSCLPAAEPAA